MRHGRFTPDTSGPLWVISAVLRVGRSLPVYPDEQTFFRVRGHVSNVPNSDMTGTWPAREPGALLLGMKVRRA